MNYNTFTSIGSLIIFSVWLYIACTAIKAYRRLWKRNDVSPFTAGRQLSSIADPETAAQLRAWKQLTKRLFLGWVTTGIGYLLFAMVINKTIGFK